MTIRDQILVPIVVIQVLAVGAISLATAALATRRGESQVVHRLDVLSETLRQASFPYTDAILAQLKALSGADFIAYDASRTIVAASDPALADNPALQTIPPASALEHFGRAPAVSVGAASYLTAKIATPSNPRVAAVLVLYPETSWRQARRDAVLPPLLFGSTALLAMVAVTGWTAARISRRIQGASAQVARIAGGDFNPFAPDNLHDEVADLARSINQMCGQLRDMSTTIQRSERTRILARLAAGLAHQLRNALTGARMSIQLHLRRAPASVDDRSLNVALRQLSLIEEQVKGLLSLGRVECRPPSPCDLFALLREITPLVEPVSEHAGVRLTLVESQTPALVLAEESGLRAAILNLILNAVEAAGRGGHVQLKVQQNDRAATIVVVDTGPGPPTHLADSLFEPFATGKPEGVGLGLALTHQVATAHGGSLSWEHDDGQTRFALTLPREDAPTPTPDPT